MAVAFSLTKAFFEWFSASDGVAALHKKHIEGDVALHMLKGTPMAAAPDSLKLDFARSGAGQAVANFMKAEQQHIGGWKVDRIVEAAGSEFNAVCWRQRLLEEVASSQVVLFSFVDCPWCLLAKERLAAIEGNEAWLPAGSVRTIELEARGRDGKALRAAIAAATGRTSMPSVWVGGRCVGGFTDGDMPSGEPGLCLAASPGFEALEASGRLPSLLGHETRSGQPCVILHRGFLAITG